MHPGCRHRLYASLISSGHDLQRPVVVAVIAVRVVQMPVHEIVHMVAVRHGLVAAAGAVGVRRVVAGTVVLGRALVRVVGRNFDHVLVDVIAMRVMQMAVVQVVDVAAVLPADVLALGAVAVVMRFVLIVVATGHIDVLHR